MSIYRKGGKRALDIIGALAGLCLVGWLIVISIVIASVDTRDIGLFRQIRIGRNGRRFYLCKIRTMYRNDGSSITTADDARITPSGRLLRRTKLDELPQLWNVLTGDMSFVGPRPEVPAYAERILALSPVLAQLRPGITGPATLRYRNEESILAAQNDPAAYNDDVVLPDKIRVNERYLEEVSLHLDLALILGTLHLLPLDQIPGTPVVAARSDLPDASTSRSAGVRYSETSE